MNPISPPPGLLAQADREHASLSDAVRSLVRAHRIDINEQIAAGHSGDRMRTTGILAMNVIGLSGLIDNPITLALMFSVAIDMLARKEEVIDK